MNEEEKTKTLADDLATYGVRSLRGLRNGAKELNRLASILDNNMSSGQREWANFLLSSMPGYRALESVRLGREASDLWDKGNYLDSADRYLDAIDASSDEAFWFVPGGGIVKRLGK